MGKFDFDYAFILTPDKPCILLLLKNNQKYYLVDWREVNEMLRNLLGFTLIEDFNQGLKTGGTKK